MKIIYSTIQFEITRKCNQSCDHCCRGESQNLDLTKEVVDAFFDKNNIYEISRSLFSGGEPTLNGEILEYIVDKLIEKQIKVSSFMLSINGLSYSEALTRGLSKLNEYCKKCDTYSKKLDNYGFLFISQDQFHKAPLDDVVDKFSELSYFIPPYQGHELTRESILPYGNAIKNSLTDEVPNLNEITNYDGSYKIKEYEGEIYLIFDYQYISSNGNVLKDGCISYDMMDTLHIGNVLDKSIIEMFDIQNKRLNKKI